MRILIVDFIAYTLFTSCNESKQKINHEFKVNTVATLDNRIHDSTRILVSELPIKFDSTNVLLFAEGMVDLQECGVKKICCPAMINWRQNSNIIPKYFAWKEEDMYDIVNAITKIYENHDTLV